MQTPKPPTDPQDNAQDAAQALGFTPDQRRQLDRLIHLLGKTERPEYRGGRAYPRIEGGA